MTAGRMLAFVCVGVVLALLLTVVGVAGVARAQDGVRPSPVTRHVDTQLRVACYTTPNLSAISCVHIPGTRSDLRDPNGLAPQTMRGAR